MTNTPPKKPASFEDAMERLEAIVQELDASNVTLETSLTLYEEGERLRRFCEEKLKQAEERIEKISLNEKGEPVGLEEFSSSSHTSSKYADLSLDCPKDEDENNDEDNDLPF